MLYFDADVYSCYNDADIFLKDWLVKCHFIVMQKYLKCLLVKQHILMQIYIFYCLLIKCHIRRRYIFKVFVG